MHILIVDDELSIRETFQVFLEEEGYDATTAADFFEAESFLADHSCDIVVADIVLPRINGLMLLQRVHKIDEDIPVIMVTGEPDVATAVEAVRYGAYDYMAKPVTQEVLLRVVGRAVEKKRLLDEKRRLEAENQAYQVDLERKVAERTAKLKQRNRELAALIEIGRDISATLDLTEVLKRVTQRATKVCGAHRCTIWLLTRDGEKLEPIMSQLGNGHIDRKIGRRFKDASQPWQVENMPEEIRRIVVEHRPLFIPDASTLSMHEHWIEPFGIKSVLIVPLISKDQCIGLMALDHVEEGQAFTAEQVDLAMAIAAQSAVATENARLFATEQQRATALAHTLEQQRELDHLQNEFMQNVSHELRTPLAIARGYAELLDVGNLGELQPEQRESMTIIARRLRMLSKLVDDINAILEIKAHELQREPVALADLAHTILADFHVAAEQHELTLTVEVVSDPPLVFGDTVHLRRVLDNLMSNALKFTPAGGRVTVRLGQEGKNAMLEVADTGVGIPSYQLERIFERFYQVDGSTTRRYGGTGLGLALVKEIVEAHGGTVSVQSMVDEGSTFRIYLPAYEEDPDTVDDLPRS